mgnify:CR=1 FL=1
MDGARLQRFVSQLWDDAVVPSLIDYIRIPNKSPAFDPDWVAHGHMDAAVKLMEAWARARLSAIAGAKLDVLLKVNSGMNRLGVAPAEYPQALKRLQANARVGDITLMTHFASADEVRARHEVAHALP